MTDLKTYTPDPEIARLIAQRRKALASHTVQMDAANTYRDDEGNLIQERTIGSAQGHTETVETNLSTLMRAAPSTTADVEMLVIEAKLAAEGEGGDNPHIPKSETVRERALDQLDELGLEPAWRVAE